MTEIERYGREMTRISNNIHEWADEYANGHTCDYHELQALVYRIDTEMVYLPKSADGKIWTGREVCFWTGAAEGDWHKFHSLTYTDGRWCVEDNHWQRYPAESVWYERPDSWESIADEVDEIANSFDSTDDRCEKLADIADSIRKLAEKEKK